MATTGEMQARAGLLDPAANVYFSSVFDSGNGVLMGGEVPESGPVVARVSIAKEPFTEGTDKRHHKQWFYFQLSNVLGRACQVELHVGETSYPDAWTGYWATYSIDQVNWLRAPTQYDAERLTVTFNVEALTANRVYFAYFTPYAYEQHRQLVAEVVQGLGKVPAFQAQHEVVAQSVQGRDIDLFRFGTGPLQVWIIARQHPGESMAEWYMQGLLKELLAADPAGDIAALLQQVTLNLVPNMNPDGSFLGHLRTNAVGANLNREWGATGDYAAPTLERSPEVYGLCQKLERVGCDLFMDVHGDEELPHIFFAGTQGVPRWSPRLAVLYHQFTAAQLKASPHFQTKHGYGNDEPGKANLAICGDAVAQRYDCLAVTLEMPFKAVLREPDMVRGWNPERIHAFAATLFPTLTQVAPMLRAEFPFPNVECNPAQLPDWTQPGYENPPSEEVWPTTA
ncbi:uncharacterized protein MONBRDRAFT_37633 [Monosiga brevicollis MX1]|uniref:Peptidase M14 domain-containing protein n=1 Tax=Monosiga brevicollis TaxID=81824 RepID=A9V2Z0_MONBE|nr:uncharacterized protein MONBRDRAFT_37633 [Monosiga brevicollis MX1]EDQ88098.1 predicted protein [Monosiga brevicollis MX1]|eukprot:XP_001747174.1 hypothetical protein [Monosiga brevicollis MX1]